MGTLPIPRFSAHFYCGQMAGCIKMPLGMDVGLSPGDYVLDEGPVSLPKRGRSPPKFSAHVYCGQTAGSIKMPLGMEVGFCPGDFVLDGDPAPLPNKGAEPGGGAPARGWSAQFSAHVYCGQTAGWIKMALGMEVGVGPGHIVLDGDRAPLPKKGTEPPILRPIFIVAKRLDASRYHLVWR